MECGRSRPPEEMLRGGVLGDEESKNQRKNGLTVIAGGGKKRLKALKNDSRNNHLEGELPDKEILQRVRKIMDTIEVHHREWTGGRMKKYSTITTRVFAGHLPVDLLNEIHKFRGSNTYHLEAALRLYVKVMGTKD